MLTCYQLHLSDDDRATDEWHHTRAEALASLNDYASSKGWLVVPERDDDIATRGVLLAADLSVMRFSIAPAAWWLLPS